MPWNPQDYRQHASAQHGWARELIDRLALSGGERILDLGCGDGKITAELAQRVVRGSVLGLDNSPEMVAYAREQFGRAEYPNLAFELADARDLSFSAEFDRVFSNATLHWIRDHRPVLRSIHAALRPGGRLVAQMGGKGNAAGILAAIDEVVDDPRWCKNLANMAFPYGFYAADEYRVWLEEAGFSNLRVELIARDMTHHGQVGLEGWVRTTWLPYLERVPAEHRSEFISLVVGRYLERHPVDREGMTHVGMWRLEVEAERPMR